MVVVLLLWLALSVVVCVAFVFGSGLGYRRGFEDAIAAPAEHRAPGAVSPAARREIHLPEDVRYGP